MSLLPQEITDRFGSFRAAWTLAEGEGYITREYVVGSDWFIFWMKREGRWEYLPFGTIEGEVERIPWRPLIGDIEVVATAIGNTRKLWLVVEKEINDIGVESWWWMIYWRYRGTIYRLSTRRTNGPFVAVV
jgi:hypothetical protein